MRFRGSSAIHYRSNALFGPVDRAARFSGAIVMSPIFVNEHTQWGFSGRAASVLFRGSCEPENPRGSESDRHFLLPEAPELAAHMEVGPRSAAANAS